MAPIDEAKRLVQRVLKVHACGGKCRDAMLATAVLAANGPFSLADAEPLLSTAPEDCPILDGAAWAAARERDVMHRELTAHWDAEKHQQLDARGAKLAAAAAGAHV